MKRKWLRIDKILLFSLALFSISLSFDPDWSSKALILVCVFSFFGFRSANVKKIRLPFFVITLVVLFTLTSSFLHNTLAQPEIYSIPGTMLIFFLTIAINERIGWQHIKLALFFFTLGVGLVGLSNLVLFFFNGGVLSNIYGSWNDISMIDIHKTYYAAFVNLLTAISWHFTFERGVWRKWIHVGILIFSWIMFYFMGSKSGMGVNVLLNLLFVFQFLKINRFKTIVSLISLVPILMLVLMSFSYVQHCFILFEGEASRVRNYNINKELILKKPILGYGTGNEFNMMQQSRDPKSWEYKNRYNAHNEYLHVLLGGGIVLLILYMLIFYLVFQCTSSRFMLPAYFLVVIAYVCMIESFLERHHGVFLVAFFVNLFYRAKGIGLNYENKGIIG